MREVIVPLPELLPSYRGYLYEWEIHDLPGVLQIKPDPRNAEYCFSEEMRVDSGLHRRWYGVPSTKDAYALFENGWPEGAERAMQWRDELLRITPPPRLIKRRRQWMDDGDELDYERMRAGLTDQMWKTASRRKMVGPRVIDISTSFGGNCWNDSETLFWNGAAMLVIADLLEQAGYQTEIGATIEIHYPLSRVDRCCLHRIIVKRAGESLRMDSVAAVLSHPAIFRVIMFRAFMAQPWDVGPNLGSCREGNMETPLRDKLIAMGEIPRPEIMLGNVYAKDTAVQSVMKALRRYTVEDADV